MKPSFFQRLFHREEPVKTPAYSETLFRSMPSHWVVIFAYLAAGIFCYGAHQFFLWFPPYLYEVFKNLRGLPTAWADLGLLWGERGLVTIAIAAALYHHLWQLSARYVLSNKDIRVETWFPVRRVTAVPYAAVRRAGFQQSPLGIVLNYGHIEIDTASQTPLVLVNCPQPALFLKTLQSKVESALKS
jgi:hypothetical protein